jgi:hypothetical protein
MGDIVEIIDPPPCRTENLQRIYREFRGLTGWVPVGIVVKF